MKACSTCKIEKDLDQFNKNPNTKDGHGYQCKPCNSEYQKAYRAKNKKILNEKQKEHYKENRKDILAKKKKDREKNPEKYREWGRKWNDAYKEKRKAYLEKNKEYIKERRKRYREKNKEKERARKLAHAAANKEYYKNYGKEYREKNKEKIYKRMKKYKADKRENDPGFVLNERISLGIRLSLKGIKNGAHWEDLVGYSVDELKRHIEKNFQDGMTWENRDQWHIDHIIPQSVFNFTSPEHDDFKRCWALKNLRPLWATENQSKGAKLEKPFQPRLALECTN